MTPEQQSTVPAAGTSTVGGPVAAKVTAEPDPSGVPRQAFVAQVMGLPISVHVRGPHARTGQVARVVAEAFDALRADDQLFSTWNPDSPVSRIRRGQESLADAHPRIREAAALCDEAERRTGGSFSAWLPGRTGGPMFDPTGLVKGWAAEQACRAVVTELEALGRHDVLLSAGGDVIVASARTDTPDWIVGIEDPRDRRRMLRTVPLRCGAVATSGSAARGAHIVDPASGAAPADLLSATVIGESLTWADVYATAAFVKGLEASSWIATLHGHAAVLLDRDGTVQTVAGDGFR